jgi:hypothetical protein
MAVLKDEGGEHRDLIGSIAALLWVVFAFVMVRRLRALRLRYGMLTDRNGVRDAAAA